MERRHQRCPLFTRECRSTCWDKLPRQRVWCELGSWRIQRSRQVQHHCSSQELPTRKIPQRNEGLLWLRAVLESKRIRIQQLKPQKTLRRLRPKRWLPRSTLGSRRANNPSQPEGYFNQTFSPEPVTRPYLSSLRSLWQCRNDVKPWEIFIPTFFLRVSSCERSELEETSVLWNTNGWAAKREAKHVHLKVYVKK